MSDYLESLEGEKPDCRSLATCVKAHRQCGEDVRDEMVDLAVEMAEQHLSEEGREVMDMMWFAAENLPNGILREEEVWDMARERLSADEVAHITMFFIRMELLEEARKKKVDCRWGR